MKIQWTHVARTALSVLIGLAPSVPELLGKLGVGTTVGVGAIAISVAALVTRLMLIPAVDQKVNAFLGVK
jgi:hypothetical protein